MKSVVKYVILSQLIYLDFGLYLRIISNQFLKNICCYKLAVNDQYT